MACQGAYRHTVFYFPTVCHIYCMSPNIHFTRNYWKSLVWALWFVHSQATVSDYTNHILLKKINWSGRKRTNYLHAAPCCRLGQEELSGGRDDGKPPWKEIKNICLGDPSRVDARLGCEKENQYAINLEHEYRLRLLLGKAEGTAGYSLRMPGNITDQSKPPEASKGLQRSL